MKRIPALLALFILAFGRLSGAAEALDDELFPAEFLAAHREALGLNEAQMEVMAELMRGAKTSFDENKRTLEEAARALQKLLREDEPNLDKVDEQMREVLDREGDIKMLHLHTMLAVRKQLTKEQLAKARALRDQLMAKAAAEAGRKERMEKRLEELRAAIHKRAETGPLPEVLMDRAREVQELMNAGKDAEAEKKVEEIFGLLGEKPKP